MQPVVLEAPYQFVPPSRGLFWPRLLNGLGRYKLRRSFGVEEVSVSGLEHLRSSLASGHGILLAPNHCRPCDPFVVGEACRQAGTYPFVMASWHLFKQSRLQTFLLRRAGAFSIYREGLDRQAISTAADVLSAAGRPLVIFPEGVISRHNDRLNAMMDGTAFIARSAAKKRLAAGAGGGEVVLHPVAIRYEFTGNIEQALHPVLDEIEHRLSWQPRRSADLVDRIYRVGESLLCLKEMEYLGSAQSGPLFVRVERLIDQILIPMESEWLKGRREATTVARVKQLRIALLPEMVQGTVTPEERARRWKLLADMYLAQQLSCYPADYLRENPTKERLLETVERFEEDLTDKCRVHRPIVARVEIGPAISVSPQRERGTIDDPLMVQLERQISGMLELRSPAESPLPLRVAAHC